MAKIRTAPSPATSITHPPSRARRNGSRPTKRGRPRKRRLISSPVTGCGSAERKQKRRRGTKFRRRPRPPTHGKVPATDDDDEIEHVNGTLDKDNDKGALPPTSATVSVATNATSSELLFFQNTTRSRLIEQERLMASKSTTEPLRQRGLICVKCHKQTVRYKLVQVRCGDEGSSALLKCLSCKHSWRRD